MASESWPLNSCLFGIEVEETEPEMPSTSFDIADTADSSTEMAQFPTDILPVSMVKQEPLDDNDIDTRPMLTAYEFDADDQASDTHETKHTPADEYPSTHAMTRGRQGAEGAVPIVSVDGKRLLCPASRMCAFTCAGAHSMRRHVRACHGELDPYTHKVIKYARFECQFCPKQLISRANKAKHERSCTRNPDGLHLTAATNGKHGFKMLPLCPAEGCVARFVEYHKMAEHYHNAHSPDCRLLRAFFDSRDECDAFRRGLADAEGWRKKNDHGKGSFILYVCGEKSSAMGSAAGERGKVCTSFCTEKTQYDGLSVDSPVHDGCAELQAPLSHVISQTHLYISNVGSENGLLCGARWSYERGSRGSAVSISHCPQLGAIVRVFAVESAEFSMTTPEESMAERLSRLYPSVDQSTTAVPCGWSAQDKDPNIGLSHTNLKLTYRGLGKNPRDAAAVRTSVSIPSTCGVYYYEVKIMSKGRDGFMGIGLCTADVSMNRLPGWDPHSYGYHGDDGFFFCSSGTGAQYGPTFTTGDIIGCGCNFVDNSIFFTKNGQFLGLAQKNLPSDLYPTVGLQSPGEMVDTNFGQEAFKFDIVAEMADVRQRVRHEIVNQALPAEKTDWFNSLVSSYLAHQGFGATADAFATAINAPPPTLDTRAHKTRQRACFAYDALLADIHKLVLLGRMTDAMAAVNKAFPTLLRDNPLLHFMLKVRQLIEMIAGVDVETRNPPRSTSSSPAHSRSQGAPYPMTKSGSRNGTSNGHGGGRRTRSSIVRAPHTNGATNGHTCDTLPSTEDYCTCSAHDVQDMDCSTPSPTNGQTSNGDAVEANASAIAALPLSLVQVGRELRHFSQTLPATDVDVRLLLTRMSDAFELIAYADPWSSPASHILSADEREPVAQALNRAILHEEGGSTESPLEALYEHAGALHRSMAGGCMGVHAFVDTKTIVMMNATVDDLHDDDDDDDPMSANEYSVEQSS